MISLSREIRRRLAIALGIIGIILIVIGLPIGYIDVALYGLTIAMIGEAIMLQERKRPG